MMIFYASYEDYLYIIIGIVWVIFSFYNAKRKKKAKEARGSESGNDHSQDQAKTPSFLDSLIEEMGLNDEKPELVYDDPFYEDNQLQQKTEKAEKTQNYSDDQSEKVFSYDDYYEESNYKLSSDVNDNNKTAGNTKKTTTDTIKNSSKEKVKKVDLKKAIIYSEILKQRYF